MSAVKLTFPVTVFSDEFINIKFIILGDWENLKILTFKEQELAKSGLFVFKK